MESRQAKLEEELKAKYEEELRIAKEAASSSATALSNLQTEHTALQKEVETKVTESKEKGIKEMRALIADA